MAKYKNPNVVMHGLSGIVGDLLMISQRYGKTYVGKIPQRTDVLSEDQNAIRERFLKAVFYAKKALADPEIRSIYEQRAAGGITAYNLALADYFKAPFFGETVTTGYDGTPGSIIDLAVHDDTLVKSVEVTIVAADGSQIEKGNAVQNENSPQWIYTTTAVNSSVAGCKVIVAAKDNPGNLALLEFVLS